MISMKSRKGMGMALTLVVTAVVLIVISLVIITMTTSGLSKFGESNNEQMEGAGDAIADTVAIGHCTRMNAESGAICYNSEYGADTKRPCDEILGDSANDCSNDVGCTKSC